MLKNCSAPTDLDRRRSGGPFRCVDTAVQAELHGAYRNDHIYHRIVSELAACRFQRNVKQCRDKTKKKYKEVINRHRRSRVGVELDKEVMQGDFRFFSQIHCILGSRAVVNPPLVHQIRETYENIKSRHSTLTQCTPRLRQILLLADSLEVDEVSQQ